MNYLDLIKDINYFSYLGAFVKWSFIFLLFSGLPLIIGYKLDFFKRKNKVLNVLAKFYYAIIPIYFLVFALKFAPIINTQKELTSVIEANEDIIINYTSAFLDAFESDSVQLDEFSMKGVVDNYISEYISKVQKNDKIGRKIGRRTFNKIKNKIENNVLLSLIKFVINRDNSSYQMNKTIQGDSYH